MPWPGAVCVVCVCGVFERTYKVIQDYTSSCQGTAMVDIYAFAYGGVCGCVFSLHSHGVHFFVAISCRDYRPHACCRVNSTRAQDLDSKYRDTFQIHGKNGALRLSEETHISVSDGSPNIVEKVCCYLGSHAFNERKSDAPRTINEKTNVN